MSKYKFLTKEPYSRLGVNSFILYDLDGNEIVAFSYFCNKIAELEAATRKRYEEVVAHFIDYLIAARVLGAPTTRTHLNRVIDAYPFILRDGSKVRLEKIKNALHANPDDAWAVPVLECLTIQPYAKGSFSNTLAGINKFLRISDALATEAFEIADLLSLQHNNDFKTLSLLLDGVNSMSPHQIRNMRANSMLGSVIRFHSKGLTRPRGLAARKFTEEDADAEDRDFPMEYVFALAESATNYRDRAFWLFLAASGLRASEALSVRWLDIDFKQRKIKVFNPKSIRFYRDLARLDTLRWKGRANNDLYLIAHISFALFEALEAYLKFEYVPCGGVDGEYVFQYVENGLRGKPYVDVSDKNLQQNFKRACTRACVSQPTHLPHWTVHSLRHLYGMYLLNDIPLEGGLFGLELVEVQLLMGHKKPQSTMKYARKNKRILEKKLEQADEYIMQISPSSFKRISSIALND